MIGLCFCNHLRHSHKSLGRHTSHGVTRRFSLGGVHLSSEPRSDGLSAPRFLSHLENMKQPQIAITLVSIPNANQPYERRYPKKNQRIEESIVQKQGNWEQ